MSLTDRPILEELADRVGIVPAYIGLDGFQHPISDRTRRAVLAAMGVDASTAAAAARSLEELRDRSDGRILPPVRVVEQGATQKLSVIEPGTWRDGTHVTDWEVEVTEEGGERHRVAGYSRTGGAGVSVPFPAPLPLGYHHLRLAARMTDGRRFEEAQSLIVTPGRCSTSTLGRGGRRFYGLLTQLYTVRSKTNWGIGDLGDLKRLVRWSAEIGAAFVGLNPLHALENRDDDISPYSPVSRLYRNEAYIDVMAIPELHRVPAAAKLLASPTLRRAIEHLREKRHVDYERVMDCKRPVLEVLHRAFAARHSGRLTSRGRAYRRYLATEGQALTDFATFAALRHRLGTRGRRGRDWRNWPVGYRDPRSAMVRTFAGEHAEEINFHRFLQFELDRQLGAAASRARSAGLAIGLYQDLAIGSSRTGSDTWAFPHLFLRDVTLGSPPDPFHSRGQDWCLPPVDPRRLAVDGYHYWIRLVRAAFAHAGALRIDHVMGLFRQFWIPDGRSPVEGAYVRFPADDLLGILALESVRTGALVIGEDLGTVPRGLPAVLERRGILCTRVLYFARDKGGSFWPARSYPRRALVSANTHDMTPLAGYWSGHDLDLRRQSGQIGSDKALAAARSEREQDRRLLRRRLAAEGILGNTGEPRSRAELCSAVTGFLCRTPAALVGITLDDLVGEVEPVNLPGVGSDKFPSWSHRLELPIEALPTDTDVREALQGAVRSRRCQPVDSRVSRRGRDKPKATASRRRRQRSARTRARSKP